MRERPVHHVKPDEALRRVEESLGHCPDGREAERLVQADGAHVRGGDGVELHAAEARPARPLQQVREQRALDVHKQQVTACVHVPDQQGRRSELRAEFSTVTSELLALRDWLKGLGVTDVAMEATGVYWKPVYYLLEDDFELWLVNAQHVKNVPGRKTDVQDAQWLCQLLEHGLVRASFVPPKPIRELRDLTRYRKSLVWERSREANRLQKLLEDANIKLGDVASDVLGASGKAMLRALCAGEADPDALAERAKGKLRAKLPALRLALEGRFSAHHALLVSHLLSHVDISTRRSPRSPRRSTSACALSSRSVSCSARSRPWPRAPPR
jgi:transposase